MTHIPDFAQDFKGRTALVTGAASGIGKACAEGLAARGASKLILIDLDENGIKALDLPCDVQCITGSVADRQLWADLEAASPTIDHAIVNAGIGTAGMVDEISFEDWRKVMDVNLDGAFLTLSTALRCMPKGGGSAVVVSSTTGLKPVPGIGPYGVSKAAVAHMARIAAAENAGKNIRVNAIAPGGVDTNIWDSSEAFRDAAAKHGRDAAINGMASVNPNGRFASSEEMANSILYLLSDAASNITGTVLVSDGGFTL
jgi:NAD(P)-dependent dehydrogenase (short-subunit alcohol dehydrogenase family)